MNAVDRKYIVALVLVVVVVVGIKLMNPHRKYSTQQYWRSATLEAVHEVPDQALQVGNKNGSVLMWAAIASTDPGILRALVERGADVNESDPVFSGTPLTGAAGYNSNPEIVKVLVELGADINKTINNKETALMIAAQYNTNDGIIETLVSLGADLNARNAQSKSALDLAKENNNRTAEEALSALIGKS